MSLLAVARKTVTEAVRRPKALAITMGLPVVFMLIFGFAFGAEGDGGAFPVAVLNEDEGTMGAAYVAGLRNLTTEDGAPLLDVTVVTGRDAGLDLVEERDAAAFVVVPPDFSRNLTWGEGRASGGNGLPVVDGGNATPPTPPPGTVLEVLGDPAWGAFSAAVQILGGYSSAFGAEATGLDPGVRTRTGTVVSQELTEFDFIAPGLMVFAILNIIPQAAVVVAREEENHTMDRIRLSPVRADAYLGGVALAQVATAAVSVALMFATAELMGFHNQGVLWQGYLVALLVVPSVVGVGLILGAFVARQEEAANLGALVAVPVSFLSGAFFPLPSVELFTWGERTIGLYDILPSTHAVDALRAHLTLGTPVADLGFELSALVVLAVAYFVVGLALFRRRRLNRA